ncbi:anthocyanidin 3-O-glucosyltransferase 2-like [Dorcoceras hygrometricum]|uniref:Anthocyanidin 3-O-glucosyltransferase 2-like n=1 Tax=Dorcoceras hygrometricum TaxID=472368 RepID=A0A2Z7CNV0_9LAMI|nr:anthocyanidin 3-O-glucosyltransferase 2-like [Dorcoceras hygrometricum]
MAAAVANLACGSWPHAAAPSRLALHRATMREAAHSHGATIAQGCWTIGRPSRGDGAQPSADVRGQRATRVFSQLPCWRLGAWLRPVSRGNRHFTVGGGGLRQSGPRPEGRLLRQPALEGLTRSARTDSPRKIGRKKFRRRRRWRRVACTAAAADFEERREEAAEA